MERRIGVALGTSTHTWEQGLLTVVPSGMNTLSRGRLGRGYSSICLVLAVDGRKSPALENPHSKLLFSSQHFFPSALGYAQAQMQVLQENIDTIRQEIEDLEEELKDVRAACVWCSHQV